MKDYLEKVTVFITRGKANKIELLLFEHPNAGIQLPAGTVEINENHYDAALREAEKNRIKRYKDNKLYWLQR